MTLHIRPISLADANAFVLDLHRHHGRAQGHKFSLCAMRGDKVVGVAIVGRPVARLRDDGETLEVTRLCTDGAKNACSALYGACARVAREMGYARIGTYILAEEIGASLRASGWVKAYESQGGLWNNPAGGRPRKDDHPTGPKHYYQREFRHA